MQTEQVVFGGGCFWCTEAVFSKLKGVQAVKPGYAGGTVPDPSYEDVCSGRTGHAEVVSVTYDPAEISFDDLLTVFFATHDPTTPNRQGADVGTQYRSAIFYSTDAQRAAAERFIARLNENGAGVVTELHPLTAFYPAEDYHERYYERNADAPYCQAVINPKMAKLREQFKALLAQ